MSPSSMVGGSAMPFVERWQADSAAAAEALAARWRRSPGGSWWVDPQRGAPTVVFVHGGYWQELSAADSLFAGPTVVGRGWGFAAVEYPLAPVATIPEMIDAVAGEVAELAMEVDGPLTLVGHSAGAQLVAAAAADERFGVAVEQLVLVSGVFDLADIVATTINAPLGLDLAAATELSPLRRPGLGRHWQAPVEIIVGQFDTPRFIAHSTAYAAHLRRCGVDARLTVRRGDDHFSIVTAVLDELTRPGAVRR